MPGILNLGRELGVNHNTIDAALQLLEQEKLLESQGSGKPRRIVPQAGTRPPALQVAILPYGGIDKSTDYMIQLQNLLGEAGHTAFYTRKTLTELGMQLPRVVRMVEETQAYAWVVCAGSREILEWFANGPLPIFAMFGRRRDLTIAGAGPDKSPAFAEVVRRLAGLGHRRIVLLAHRERRLPEPGEPERRFLQELAACGIATSNFNLPDWEDSIEGLQQILHSLFSHTPPTAIIAETYDLLLGTQQFLVHRGIRVPQHVSLISTDGDTGFEWCRPSLAHIRWDSGPLVKRIVRWTANVAKGRADLQQTTIKAKFVEGGTIGPAKK